MRVRRLSGIFFLSLAIASANSFALHYYLYWRIWWYDIPMHFLGGFIIAALVLWLIDYEVSGTHGPQWNRFWMSLLAAILVGVLWEVFEYSVGITRGEAGYLADTIQDLVLDALGGMVAYLMMKEYGT